MILPMFNIITLRDLNSEKYVFKIIILNTQTSKQFTFVVKLIQVIKLRY